MASFTDHDHPKSKFITRNPNPSCASELHNPSLTRNGQTLNLIILKRCDGKLVCGVKRSREEDAIDYRRERKRLKMHPITVRKCLRILIKLMIHPYGSGFSLPVDPVALNIPDYFFIISKPMDLGTIKSKLLQGLYATADEFEADIRLTFSNAMKYNPPSNRVHKMARELDSLFSAQLRLSKDSKQVESAPNQVGKTTSKSSKSSAVPVVVKSSAKVEIVCALRAMPSNKTEPKSKESSIGMQVPLSTSSKSSVVPVGVKSSAKAEVVCALRAMPSNMTEPKSKVSSIGMQVPLPTARICGLKEASSASPDKAFDSSNWRSPVCETLQLSPDKASLAEMLKKRFADTVLKAQKQTLFVCAADRHDRLKMEMEKKRLERQEAEAKASRDQKMQRQREREAARIALEKMENAVEIEDNFSILTDLAYMIGDFSFAGPLGGCGSMYVNRKLRRPLERFGLYLKEDDKEGDLIF